jgi:pyruvate/2-oxoacid:ferredoxin oxidoreductase beta subunit
MPSSAPAATRSPPTSLRRVSTPPATRTSSPTGPCHDLPKHPVELVRKFEKAKPFKGPKLCLAFAPCPTGGLYDPSHTQEYAKLGVESGIFPMKVEGNGEAKHTYVKQQRQPVGEYLERQGCFHLLEPVRPEGVLHSSQDAVERYWATARTEKRAAPRP